MDDDFLASIGIAPGSISYDSTPPSNAELDSMLGWDDAEFWKSIGIDPNSRSGITSPAPTNKELESTLGLTSGPGLSASKIAKALFTKTDPKTGASTLNTGMIGAVLGGLGGAAKLGQMNRPPSGYQGGIPKYVATRQAPAPGQRISGNVAFTRKAEGGQLSHGGFVIPADVVSHFGNGSSDAGLKLLASKLGAEPIRGDGDGMSDSIPTTIDGTEPAKVAHEEAYISPERVAEIGGGDAKKGAAKLRAMMERIRHARTGTTEQGREINPNKFMPGGSVKGYAPGGDVTGSAITSGLSGTESNLSNWAGPYVTDMLAKGQALSEMPYEQYTGPLTAGPSPLQTQAFDTASNLKTPSAISDAAKTAGGLASSFTSAGYNPATFNNQFQAPTTTAPTQFTNRFDAPTAYNPGQFVTDDFNSTQAAKYMNPYLEQSLAPQLAELQRQSKIALNDQMGKLTTGGAYGGGRQAIVQSENTRNLMDKINQVTGKGYDTAFQNAMTQFNADQGRGLQAQQFGEQSRQFGANQSMTAAQLQAQYGLSADQAQEAARQFNAQQGLASAQSAAQYGQAAQQAQEQSRQFGATMGLQGLQGALQAAQTQGNLGVAQQQADIANLGALAGLGTTQRGIASEQVAADKAQFEEARLNPFKMVQYQQSLLSGLPLAAQSYNVAQPSTLQQILSGIGGGAGLGGMKTGDLETALKNLGINLG